MLFFIATIGDEDIRSKLETIYELFSKAMYSRAFSVLNNAGDAEDAVQEEFIRLFKNINSIKDPRSRKTKSFALIITENCAIDIYRKRQRLNETELTEDFVSVSESINYKGDNQVAEEILKLPVKYRNVLTLRYVYELEYTEIAECMNVSTVNARKLVQRAKEKLEENLRERGMI